MGTALNETPDPKDVLSAKIGSFCDYYASQVLSHRTRSITLFGRKCVAELQDTFLGFELKSGKKRINCPDATTARYLKIFAEMGMSSVEIPYDVSITQRLLPQLENAWRDIQNLLRENISHKSSRAIREGYRKLRKKLQSVAPS